jgi:hypothetical protein
MTKPRREKETRFLNPHEENPDTRNRVFAETPEKIG